ncbi:MAG: phosphate-selective porin [Myxococcaceae bacterium]|nr:phosphate-selective porin [Myxococcaceae bacterium]
MKRSSIFLASWLPLLSISISISISISVSLVSSPLARAQSSAPAGEDVEIEFDALPAAPKPSASPKTGPTATPVPPPPANTPAPVVTPTEDPSVVPSLPGPEVKALQLQLEQLERKVAASEAAQVEREKLVEQRQAEADRAADEKQKLSLVDRIAKSGVSISGYVQTQYTHSQFSQNQLAQGGATLNQDRFLVRRGRLRLKGRWKYIRTDFEIDGSNTRGPSTSVRRATVSAVLPNTSTPDALPYLMLTVGLTEIPIGRELQQGQDQILFLERTTGGLAFFAGPVDTGMRLDSAYGPFRAQLALMNGVPVDDRASGPSSLDPKKQPDLVGRVGVDTLPLDNLKIQGGVSFLTGRGFSPGSDATKSVLEWNDSNGNGAIDSGELSAAAGRGPIPSHTFKHWAVAADLYIDVRSRLGWGRVYAEVTLANNLDRALYVADPIANGGDIRELSWYVAAIQDLTEWGFVGVRYDVYNPNSDLTDSRRGVTLPRNASLKTLSPTLGARWAGYGRITFEYDWIRDHLARSTVGIPSDLRNNQWTTRFQGEF